MTTHIEKIEAFVAAWNDRDAAAIIAAFAVDAVYHNIPMDPVVGKDRIAETVDRLLAGMTDVRWVITSIAEASDGAVLTERVDAFRLNGKPVSLPVMGIFEFRDGLIRRWADYFDLASYLRQLEA